MPRIRRIYYPKLGTFLVGLRTAKAKEDPRWKRQTHAATQAARLKIASLTRQVILRMEKGQVQNPREEVLRGFAHLYGVSPDLVIALFLKEKYAIDLGRHAAVVSSSSEEEQQTHDAGQQPSSRPLSSEQIDQLVRAAEEIRGIAATAHAWAQRLERLVGDFGFDVAGEQAAMARADEATAAPDVRGNRGSNDRKGSRKHRTRTG